MKKLTTAKEFYVELDQLNTRIESTLHSLTLRHGKIEFPSQYQHPLDKNNHFNIAGLEVTDGVHTHIMLDKPDADNQTNYDIMSSRFTHLDRLRALEIAEVVLNETQVERFYKEAKERYGETLKRLAE